MSSDRLITEAELAERWGVSLPLVRKMRKEGAGPNFVLQGERPRYLISQIEAFEDGGLLTKVQLAERWGITVSGLEKQDQAGLVPGRIKLRSLVRYQLNKIIAHEKAQTRSGGKTREPRGAAR